MDTDSSNNRDEPPLHEQPSPAVVASPSEMAHVPGEEPPWWKPGWQDRLRYVGYRWIFFVPLLGLAGLLGYWMYRVRFFSGGGIQLGFKLGGLIIAAVASLAGYIVRKAARARKEPFCIHCGYTLTGLPDNYRCPECGRPYSWRWIEEYRRDPEQFIERYRARGRLPEAPQPFDAGAHRRRRRSRDGT